MATNIAIDIGTSKIVLASGNKIVLELPSVVTVDTDTREPIYFGEKAFEKCTFLSEVEIPGSVETIKAGAFIKCSALKTVKITDGVTSIGAEAFAECKNLRDVYIPKSVIKLGKEILGAYDDNANSWSKITGIYVHTQEDSPVVEYMKKYSGVYVVFDYDE